MKSWAGFAEAEPVGGGFATDRPGQMIETLSDPPVTASAGNSFSVTSTVKNQGLRRVKCYLAVGTTRVENLTKADAISIRTGGDCAPTCGQGRDHQPSS